MLRRHAPIPPKGKMMNDKPSVQLQPGPITLYAQLARIFRDRIYSGSWRRGDEIPTLDALAEQYDVARVTVRQAIQLLTSEGLLSSRRGRRTFVTFDPAPADARPLFSSVGAVESHPAGYTIQVLDIETFPTIVNRSFQSGVVAGPYVRVRKLDRERDVPYTVSESFVARNCFDRFPPNSLEKIKIVRLVRDYSNPRPVKALEQITVSTATAEEALALKIGEGQPVARLARMFLGPDDVILLYAHYVYRGDRFCIERDISNFLD